MHFFVRERKEVETTVLFPGFRGCGIIDNCVGDVISGDTLFEIKAAGRFFRSVDLRQLLIYAALNREANAYRIANIGVVNPRLGIYYRGSLAEVSYEISGKAADELLADIVQVAAGADISR